MALRRISVRAAALLAALAGPCGAAVWHVDPNGSDAGSGSSGSPFRTIQRGVNAASAGDTVLVRDGTYPYAGAQDGMAVTINKAGTSSAWITLEADNPRGAVLDCRLVCHSYISLGASSAYWVIRGFDIRNGRWGGIFSNSGGGRGMLIQGNVIRNIGNRADSSSIGITGVYTDGEASNFKVDGNVFHDVGRTSHLTGRHDHSIYAKGHLIITNNVFHSLRNGWHIQTAAGFSGTIANNTFFGPDPVPGTVGQVMLWSNNSSLTIRNNVFHGSRGAAITTYNSSVSGGCTIDRNIAFTPGGTVSLISPLPGGCAPSGNLLNVDPQLVSPTLSALDLRLRAGSPAIDAGVPVSGLNADFDGRPRPAGAGYDLGAYEYSALAPGCAVSAASWQNVALPVQGGLFTAEWDAAPSLSGMDGIMGLSNGPASGYSALAAAVRFNNAGRIDARNGGGFAAASTIAYSPGSKYHFRLVVNLATRRYSAYVRQGMSAEQTVAADYAFRTEQASVSSLSNLGLYASTGAETICAAAITASGPPPDTAAPIISGMAATVVSSASARIAWTTSEPADGQVEYGRTTAYGSASTRALTLTTGHSIALSGLAPATLYNYRARSRDAAGNLAASANATFTTVAAPAGCAAGAGVWRNLPQPSKAATFTAEFEATPSRAKMDGIVGASYGPASAYAALAAAVRFNNAGRIDARNGGAFSATASIPYSAKTVYRFRLVVDVVAHRYSAYVRQGAGAEQLIASKLAFRTEQAKVAQLNNVGFYASSGSLTVCGAAFR